MSRDWNNHGPAFPFKTPSAWTRNGKGVTSVKPQKSLFSSQHESPLHSHEMPVGMMESFSLEEWSNWYQAGYRRLPVVLVKRVVTLPKSWSGFTVSAPTVLLESAQAGRYTYLCDRAARVIFGQSTEAQIWDGACRNLTESRRGSPFAVLSSVLNEKKVPRLDTWPAMSGGLIGVFGYDLVRCWERLPRLSKHDLALPLYAMIETKELFIFDHQESMLGIVVWCEMGQDESLLTASYNEGQNAAEQAWLRWQKAGSVELETKSVADSTASRVTQLSHSFTPEAFRDAVRKILGYIASGDTYQVNLSLRTERPMNVSPAVIYEQIRRINPSPYMGLLQLPEFSLVCGSPELLVRLVDGVVSSRPIAGTRPRGDAAAQDADFSTELLANEKERAEHLMLVDLIRNDIGRVAEFGSVHVAEFMVLERYSHVMHIVSQVEGRVAADKSWIDVLQAMFPGGTITGCPKIRTMEIIEELEPIGRGFYTGALGWISYAGEMEMNIVIRSMLVKGGLAYVQSGAGIVADSDPDRELDEALRKAQALWLAWEQANR